MKLLSSVLLSLLLGLLTLDSFAQSKITGEVVDESDNAKLTNATVMLLQAKDSILVDFTRVNQDGKFTINNPDTTNYLLLVSYPKFGDFYQEIEKGSGNKQLGKISLQSTANLIEEVLITGKIPVVIKGDTVEYDASSFVTEKNAKVEDLLKVLPGISVDANGKITAQGKTVEKVLVDGEEFFGDDPTLVTRNIRSDMVDKVQVYEKKSEEAERTGVDDGQRVQTIDLKLKEDAKKGVFGKLEGAGGVDDNSGYYLGKAAVNKFNGSQKIGAYVLGSNDGNVSLNWEEEEKFNMSETESGMTDDGGYYFYSNRDEFSYWNGKGQPRALSTGISFMDAWKEKKHKLNLNYKYAKIQNDIQESTINQTPSENGLISSNTTNNNSSDAFRHRVNTKYDVNLDSLTTLTLSLSASRSEVERNTLVDGITYQGEELTSENKSDQQLKTQNSNFSYNAYLTRKFKKEGRSISLRFGGNLGEDVGDLVLKSEANYYAIDSVDIIDQYKEIKSNQNNLKSSIVYTEPLTKRLNASIGYEYNVSNSQSINNSYNSDASGNYNDFDDEFSNDFNFNTTRNAANVTLAYKTDKIDVNFTNNLRHDDMYQKNNYEGTDLGRDYFTYNPSARFRYNITKNKSIGVRYNRNNNLPSLFQIQPLRQNTDQMNQVFGNENLKPANSNSYELFYNTYDMMKGKYIYGSASFTQNNNAIQQNVTIRPGGRREMYFENMDKPAYSANVWAGAGFDLIRKYQIKSNIGVNGGMNMYNNYIKDLTLGGLDGDYELNENTNYNYSFSYGIRKNTTKNVDFELSFEPGWRVMQTTLNPDRNSSGFTFNSSLWTKVYLPAKFAFYGNMSYSYEAPTDAFPEKFERVLIKPGITRKFLKGENLVLDFYVTDLLNQNKGFRRFQSGNAITQNSYNTISRYYMLKVSWDFTSMKGAE